MSDTPDETSLADGEAAEGPDKPAQNKITATNLRNNLKSALNLPMTTVPLPPPDFGTYEKEPGHTRPSLQKLAISTNGRKDASNGSPAFSPTVSESDWGDSSTPATHPSSSRAPSQPPTRPASRAPSMSAGKSGGKVEAPPKKDAKKVTSPSTNSTVMPTRPAKPASVHSDSGGHKFNLKDLLASGPKLARRSSQRSVASRSSRRSDSDAGSDGGKGGKAKSTAGDSNASLSKKYGVCQKVAIGKGATSVVRLAHKWDRSEEKLYAVKVSAYTYQCGSNLHY